MSSDDPRPLFAQVVRLTGRPERFDEAALETLSAMRATTERLPGYAGTDLMLVDRATATLVVLTVFASRAHIEAIGPTTAAAIEIASVVIGATAGTEVVEVFEVLTRTDPSSEGWPQLD